MTGEIKRNYWSRFCKKFNAANQYRPTVASIIGRQGEDKSLPLAPFLGVTLTRKGRLINGVQAVVGQPDPDTVTKPVLTVTEPENIYLETDQSGSGTLLRIRSKDGTEARLELQGDPEPAQAATLVERLAYSMFERRGYTPGNDKDDWFEAERRVRDAEMQLIK